MNNSSRNLSSNYRRDDIKAPVLFSLGLGYFALFFANQGIHILAVPFYQMTLGVDPFLLSVALTLPLILGSLLGPVAGHLSDRCEGRFGRRRPFIFIAAWLSGICYAAVWMVSPEWSSGMQLLYFSGTALLFYICAVFYTVPLSSLVYEISEDAAQRAEVLGFTAYFLKFGSLIYQWVFPLAQCALFASVFIGVRYVGWGIGFIIFGLFGMLPALLVRERKQRVIVERKKNKLIASLKAVIKNQSMRFLIVLLMLQMGGNAFVAMMDYYLLVYFVHAGDIAAGAVSKGILSSAYALVSIACVPLVLKLASRLGKINALKIIYILNALGGGLKWLIFTPGIGYWLVLDALLCSAVWTAMVVLIPAILSDISNEDGDRHGVTRTGMFASVHTWVLSFCGVVALLASGLSLNLMGFNALAESDQAEYVITTMRIILCGGTVLFSLIPLLLLHYCKIERQNDT